MSWLRAALCAAFFVGGPFGSAQAQDVTLLSRDGSVALSGMLLGFDGEFYRLDTIYGELTVDSSGVSCDGPGCPSLEDYVAEIQLSGAGSVGRILMPALIEVFAQKSGLTVQRANPNPDLMELHLANRDTGKRVGIFHLHLTNTDEGFADLLADEADLVLARREIREEEAKLATEVSILPLEDSVRVLALDALVPIVAPENPLTSVSLQNLSKIFAGRITNWSELGGPDAPITVHLPETSSGLWQQIDDRLLRSVAAKPTEDARRYATDLSLTNAVEKDPFGISVTSVTQVGNAKALALSGTCGFALSASRRTVKTEDYPLTAPILIYQPTRRLPKLARDFLSFTRSTAAQVVIRRAGFTDQTIEEIPIAAQGDRLLNAIGKAGPEIGLEELSKLASVMTGTKRLSLSFRFEVGSSRLDAQSRSNVAYLAQLLEAGTFDSRELVFVGFSDGDGSAEANQKIALRRSIAVLEAVKTAAETAQFDRVGMSVQGFGEAMPMACDDSAWGRQVNRRVEIWIR